MLKTNRDINNICVTCKFIYEKMFIYIYVQEENVNKCSFTTLLKTLLSQDSWLRQTL